MKSKYKIARRYQQIGSFLKSSREKAGLTQREVTDLLGYSSGQFASNAEAGISLFPPKKMKQVIRMYGLKTEHVIKLILADKERELRERLCD